MVFMSKQRKKWLFEGWFWCQGHVLKMSKSMFDMLFA